MKQDSYKKMVGVQTKNDELSQDHSNFSPFWVDHFSRMWIFVVAWWSLEKQNQQKLHITKAYAGEVHASKRFKTHN